MIVERPIASFLTVEIYSFANFVVVNCVPVAVIGELAVRVIGGWDVWENPNCGWRPRTLGNHTTRKHALRGRGTAVWESWRRSERVRLPGSNSVAQSICKRSGPVEAGGVLRRTTAGGTGTAIDRPGQN